jgi:hypothetical protein
VRSRALEPLVADLSAADRNTLVAILGRVVEP